MIKVKNITKMYGNRIIFKNFSYNFPDRGLFAFFGDSGSGKSTMLNMISGLDKNYDGTIEVNGTIIKKLSKKEIQDFRLLNIGYVFQNFNLLNLESAFNNVLLPLDCISNDKKSIKKKRVLDSLKLVNIEEKKNSQINKLSGGEKQRVAIARAIVNKPKVILCDEPTGGLDEKNSEIIYELLKKISKSTLVILASHDAESVKKYADYILTLKNEEILVKEAKKKDDIDAIPILAFEKLKNRPKVSFRFKLLYAFHKIKAKKWRSAILNLLLSLSLTGVGLSLILTKSVSGKVEEAFSTILNGNQVIISRRNETENTFNNVYSTPYSSVEKIFHKYNYLLDGIGVNYLVNFEDFFKDSNEFLIESKNKDVAIDSLSARNINDFKWIESGDNGIFYPYSVDSIDDDQIILGLAYEDMVNICFQLQIQRNYTSLGHYIYENGLNLVLKIENEFWQYDDEQIFDVVAVCESKTSTLIHTNLLWNEIVFEEMMLLPSDDDEVHEFPWEMYKIYYLQTKEDSSVFLNASLCDEQLTDYIFERTNFKYNSAACRYGEVCDLKRVYVYSADTKTIIKSEILTYLDSCKDVSDYYFTSDYGYASYSNNLFSGFSKKIFVSNKKDLIDIAIDADTALQNETNLVINLPDDVVQGNFLLSLSGGLRFSTDMSKLIYGRKPTNNNEVVISKGLAEKFDMNSYLIGKYIEIAGEIEESYDENGNLLKDYNYTKLLVVGVTDESQFYLYHSGLWAISFFRDKLGVSNFLLIPRGIVVEFPKKIDAENHFKEIKKLVNDFKVVSPIDELKSNIQTTLDYANTILIIFALLSLIVSTLFLATVIILNILESKNDINLLSVLGIKKREINSFFLIQSIVQGLISFFISAVELLFVDIFLSIAISKTLNISFTFSFNSLPVLVILLISIFVPFLVTKISLFLLRRKIRHN